MLDFDHPNVLKLLGVCFDNQLPLIILPYMANGDLKNYLITARGEEDDMLPKVTLAEDIMHAALKANIRNEFKLQTCMCNNNC